MTLILAIIATLEAIVIVCMVLRRREERRHYLDQQAAEVNRRIADHQRIAELREMVNRERRNTGKAEV